MFAATRGWAPGRSVVLVVLAASLTGVGCRSRSAPAGDEGDEAGHGGETVDTRPSESEEHAPEPAPPEETIAAENAAAADPGSSGVDDAAAGHTQPVAATDTVPDGRAPRAAALPASTGGVDPAVTAAIRRIMAPIRRCYEQELARNPAFQGGDPPPTVRAIEGRDRTVRMTLVGTSGSARVDRCLRDALRRMSFTRDDRPAHVQYPFLFSPDGGPRDLPAGG